MRRVFCVVLLIAVAGCGRSPDPIPEPQSPVAPSLSESDVERIATRVVRAELDQRDKEQAKAAAERAEEDRKQAEAAARQEMQAAADRILALDADQKRKAEATMTDRERELVASLRQQLAEKGLWGLSPAAVNFAVHGAAAPLLRDEMVSAAEKADSQGLKGALAEALELDADGKIKLASRSDLDPAKMAQLANVAKILAKGEKLTDGQLELLRNEPLARPLLERHPGR